MALESPFVAYFPTHIYIYFPTQACACVCLAVPLSVCVCVSRSTWLQATSISCVAAHVHNDTCRLQTHISPSSPYSCCWHTGNLVYVFKAANSCQVGAGEGDVLIVLVTEVT